FWSMIPSLSSDKKEREETAVVPRIFASLAWLSLGSFGLPLIAFLGKGDEGRGFSLLSLGIAAVFILTSIITVMNVKEAVVSRKASEKINLKEAFRLILKNDQLVALIGTVLMFNLMAQISGGVAIYYFKYAVGIERLFSVFTGFSGLAEIGSLLMFPILSTKIGRKKVFFLACALPVIGFLMLFFSGVIAPGNATLIAISGIVAKLGSGLTLGISTVMLADVVDYGEFKFGSRNESVIFSVQTLLVKSASAVSGWLIGMGLSMVGYVPNVAQTASAILGIKYLMIVFPILLSICGYVIYRKYYKLNGEYYDEIVETIRVKREIEA
ncbi:MAG: glycoside-pentoside-hexuronide (GPH):cation symporter, partial [Cetobacterium sp.]